MKTLVIIRGVPGAGKSTLAKALQPDPTARCEADQFFTDSKGQYHWQAHLIPAAHEWCRRKVERAMQLGFDQVIVSNTSTVRSRLDPYIDLAERHGYRVQQIVCFADFGSLHRVPEETMKAMRQQLATSLVHELQTGELRP